MRITEAQVAAAYQTAEMVFDGQLNAVRGIDLLVTEHGLNKASAGDFINDYKRLREGRVFQRAMSTAAMAYFLRNIYHAYGAEVLSIAVTSLRLHIDYYEGHFKVVMHKMRALADEMTLLCEVPKTSAALELRFEQQVESSLQSSSAERLLRLRVAEKIPQSLTVQTTVYVRNPDVVAEVLLRANGRCELCHTSAPFLRAKDNSPYLEVHHQVRLADGGEDSVENAIALCPNCHRQQHFGIKNH